MSAGGGRGEGEQRSLSKELKACECFLSDCKILIFVKAKKDLKEHLKGGKEMAQEVKALVAQAS